MQGNSSSSAIHDTTCLCSRLTLGPVQSLLCRAWPSLIPRHRETRLTGVVTDQTPLKEMLTKERDLRLSLLSVSSAETKTLDQRRRPSKDTALPCPCCSPSRRWGPQGARCFRMPGTRVHVSAICHGITSYPPPALLPQTMSMSRGKTMRGLRSMVSWLDYATSVSPSYRSRPWRSNTRASVQQGVQRGFLLAIAGDLLSLH